MQTKRTVKTPGPDHPITIEPSLERIVVSLSGRTIADTKNALTLREADYGPVYYLPLGDVDTSLLERTEHSTYCPYKGDASYYSIVAGDARSENAVWTYESPYEAVSQIKGRVSFYPDRVDAIEVLKINP